tara:strand:- start:385 stop:756 length:372 start_codon:yes stop_codon:yes gene_type:complete
MNRLLPAATALLVFFAGPSTALAADCSEDVKSALSDSKWTLTTDFSKGPEDSTVETRVAENGKMEVVGKTMSMAITCDGRQIYFDWKNQERKRYTLTLESDGSFSGSRPDKKGGTYSATLRRY